MNLPEPLPPLDLFDQTWPDVAENLACDEALLLSAEEVGVSGFLRFWELDHPVIVLGASGRIGADVHLDGARRDGVAIARRSSGGGAVVIGPGALNVTVVVPIAADPAAFRSVDTAQRSILERIAGALRVAEPGVVMLGSGDLTLGGRKFSGSAQRRLRRCLMVHASLLYEFDLPLIDRYLTLPARQPDYRENRAHADFVTNLPLSRAAIVAAIGTIGPTVTRQTQFDQRFRDHVADLARTKFRDSGWIERL